MTNVEKKLSGTWCVKAEEVSYKQRETPHACRPKEVEVKRMKTAKWGSRIPDALRSMRETAKWFPCGKEVMTADT